MQRHQTANKVPLDEVPRISPSRNPFRCKKGEEKVKRWANVIAALNGLLRSLRPSAGDTAVLSRAPHIKTASTRFFKTIAATMAARGVPWQHLSSS